LLLLLLPLLLLLRLPSVSSLPSPATALAPQSRTKDFTVIPSSNPIPPPRLLGTPTQPSRGKHLERSPHPPSAPAASTARSIALHPAAIRPYERAPVGLHLSRLSLWYVDSRGL
ncbi:hypothetical protein TPAR_00699, partial [Tolypocladium paradoxum]